MAFHEHEEEGEDQGARMKAFFDGRGNAGEEQETEDEEAEGGGIADAESEIGAMARSGALGDAVKDVDGPELALSVEDHPELGDEEVGSTVVAVMSFAVTGADEQAVRLKPQEISVVHGSRHGQHRGPGKVRIVMGEFKRGALRSSSGAEVTNPKQAIAIALHEAGMARGQRGAS